MWKVCGGGVRRERETEGERDRERGRARGGEREMWSIETFSPIDGGSGEMPVRIQVSVM